MPALCNILGTGDDEPVSIEVLKALYAIIAPDSSGAPRQAPFIEHRGQLVAHTALLLCPCWFSWPFVTDSVI